MSKFFLLSLFCLSHLFADEFHDANNLFQAKKYTEAIEAYEKLAEKKQDSAIFYNLALSYYEENLNTNNASLLANAVYNISLSYLLSPNDKAIKNLLKKIESKQKNPLHLEKLYPAYQILFIQYAPLLESILFLFFLLLVLIFVKKELHLKPIFLIVFSVFYLSFIVFIERESQSLSDNFSDVIIISLPLSTEDESQPSVAESFLVNNQDSQRFALTFNEQILWVPKQNVLQINMSHIRMIWSSR